ncbi:methyl-accepting chemotaxis protein [Ensifer sp. ENS09]|uniref:methyl-accepting chemotaxis protein n=1 Tax=Ensifer sp. ENS09 TaxID=2769263 RepID=UPI001780ED30|nr:methyl-accepting chemotaxis protein [Ensifer sp. ENS09]MBD9652920.1 methyl-accepting chemotaxis protein [Ensifer sp. ENS09]
MENANVRSFVREYGPISVFVLMTTFGAAIIWVGKLFDIDISVITTIPILLMLAYLTLNLLPGLRVRSEQAGDNLYYMGFIFTLASLGISLYKFTGEASIEDVVRNFGIAIISTITGIALRIFYNQMRRDPGDIDAAVRIELSEMTRRVRTELDTSALEFSSYRRTSNQMLMEGFEEIARQAEKNGEAIRASIEAMSVKATQTIQEASEKLMATLDKTHEHVAELAQKNVATVGQVANQVDKSVAEVVRQTEALCKAMGTATERFSSARSPEEVLRVDVTPAVEALKGLVDGNLAAIEANSTAARDGAKKVITALGPFKQVATHLNTLSADIKDSTAASASSAAALASASGQIQEAAKAMHSMLEAERKSAERLKELAGTVNTLDLRSSERAARYAIHADRIEKALNRFEAEPSAAPVLKIVADGDDPGESTPAISGTEAKPGGDTTESSTEPAEPETEKPRWSIWNR